MGLGICLVILGMFEGGYISIIGLILIVIVCFVIGYTPDTHYEYDYKFTIYAIKDNSMIEGSRFYIQQDYKYYYLAGYKSGKKMYYVDRSNAYIVEDDSVTPYIEVYKQVFNSNSKVVNFLFGFKLNRREYKIVVPTNTTTKEFKIDMGEE